MQPSKNLLPPFPPIFLSCFDLFAAADALTVCCEEVVDSVCLLLMLLLLYQSGGGLQQHLKAFYLLFPVHYLPV